jgi:hypothetical protein
MGGTEFEQTANRPESQAPDTPRSTIGEVFNWPCTLATIIAGWPTLPDTVTAAIVATIQTAGDGRV